VKRPGWFSRPLLSVLVAGSWLLLQQSLSLPNVITALVLGLALPRLLHGFVGERAPWRSTAVALRLLGVVVWDIVVSNVVVARALLRPGPQPQPAWVVVPLDLQHPTATMLFAAIITTTPGTVSCVVDEERRQILVHALVCNDPADAAAGMKARYEAPLKEIFG
jgi:multicomponent K+:H+ antiporter subunit E